MAEEKLKETKNTVTGNKKYLVAFLDILGFQSHIKNYLKPQKESDKLILENIKSAYQTALNYINYLNKEEYSKEQLLQIQYKQFSDCTCLSIPCGNSKRENAFILSGFLNMLKIFHRSMLNYDLLIRGGVSIGCHYEDENIIFSEGLIKAYNLESKALFPRIILDDKLIKHVKEIWEDKDLKFIVSNLGVHQQLLTDWDGSVFINSFNLAKFIEKLNPNFFSNNFSTDPELMHKLIKADEITQKSILNNLENKINSKQTKSDKKILIKYIWLKELLMWNLDPENSRIKFEYLLK